MRVLLLALFLALTAQAPAMAHRVNIFAYVEGNDVLVECVFSTSSPVRNGQINVRSRPGPWPRPCPARK